MLNAPFLRPARQRGIVLIMALIVLVALTLAALALTRSTYTSTAIAGNLSFQQAATHAADSGIEQAVAWLEANNGQVSTPSSSACSSGSSVLACDQAAYGYKATKDDPSGSQSWDLYWQQTVSPGKWAKSLATDTNGYTVSYLIQRMCSAALDAQAIGNYCTVSPVASSSSCQGGSSCDAQMVNLGSTSQVYYRITVQVIGPHNAQSYVQSMVAL
jgi:type IV pilus assembly protein PilX